jgi:Icc-related predicted phosphoesterase
VRIAALADLHCKVGSSGLFQALFTQASQSADVIVICGDLTDHGLPEEAHVLVHEMANARAVPIVAVLGNHDLEAGEGETVKKILCDAGVQLLDGDAVEVRGIGFAGTKGFAGGFGRGTLSAFGESAVKKFVQEAIDEAMKLEAALHRLRMPNRVAVLHYAPVRGTVEGEPPEIFPFLGCSRLEEPLNRYQVTACLHGHAHTGSAESRTTGGAPVYNVALPLMRKQFPDRPPFRILELDVTEKKADLPSHDAIASSIRPAGVIRPTDTIPA